MKGFPFADLIVTGTLILLMQTVLLTKNSVRLITAQLGKSMLLIEESLNKVAPKEKFHLILIAEVGKKTGIINSQLYQS